MNNTKFASKIAFLAAAALLTIYCCVKFFMSFSKYDDGWGTSVGFDEQMVVYLLCSICFLTAAVVNLLDYLKPVNNKKNIYYLCAGVVLTISTFYPLGVFFKAMAKKKPYGENSFNLYFGIFALVLLVGLVLSYLSEKKNND